MNKIKSILNIVTNAKPERHEDIIDDAGLIDQVIKLNFLRDSADVMGLDFDVAIQKKERELMTKINQINAEMRWMSQRLAINSSSAA